MNTRAHFVQPPRVATWLVNLFTRAEDESIVGDLFEEFFQLASQSGVAVARRWYWRQTLKSVVYLFCETFRVAPWPTTGVIVAGFFVSRLFTGLPDKALAALTDKYLFYWSNHFKAYMFLATDGMLMAHLVGLLIVGCLVALAAKGREMVATMTLAFVSGAMIVSALVWAAIHLPMDVGWRFWAFAEPFALLVGGMVVRTGRSAWIARRVHH